MAKVMIKDFKGVNLKEGLWENGYSAYTYGLDLYGFDRNPNKVSYPGVLQSALPLSAGAQASGVSAVTELQLGFTTYGSFDFSIGTGNPGRLYRRNSGTWTFMTTSALGSCAGNSCNLDIYNGKMYIVQLAQIGTWDGANFTANVNALSDSTQSPRPTKVFAGNIYFGDNRYIAKFDGTTFTATALTLPSDFTIHAMEVLGDRLYVTCTNGLITKLIGWDGISPTYNSFIDLLDEPFGAKIKLAGGLLWIIPNRSSGSGVPIYLFDGAFIQKVQTLPLQITKNGGAADYAGSLVFASDNAGATAVYEDGVGGIWMVGRTTASEPFYTAMPFLPRSPTQVQFGAISPSMNYVSVSDIANGTFEIFELQSDGANGTSIWESLPIDAGATSSKSWAAIKLNFDTLAATDSVVVKYRLNDTAAWTTLKTFAGTTSTVNTDRNLYVPIARTSRTISIRIELTTAVGGAKGTRLHSFTLYYEPTGN